MKDCALIKLDAASDNPCAVNHGVGSQMKHIPEIYYRTQIRKQIRRKTLRDRVNRKNKEFESQQSIVRIIPRRFIFVFSVIRCLKGTGKGYMMNKEKQTNQTESCYDGICVTGTAGYDSTTDLSLRRRTAFLIEGGGKVTEHRYNIGGQLFTVRSIFENGCKKTPTNIIQWIIDSDMNRNDNSL